MKYRFSLAALLIVSGMLPSLSQAEPTLTDVSTEHARLNLDSPDGDIPPLVGVHSMEIYHATHELAFDPLRTGYTYNHHVDMAIWKGRFYVAWTNGKRDEDVAPDKQVYVTSPDGATWSEPVDLFGEGIATAMRMYFFHAPNGRMLATAGVRIQNDRKLEKDKGGLLVREIRADDSLGPVYTLIPPPAGGAALVPQPEFTISNDAGFVDACRQLLANNAYLEQQDLGVLLGKDRRMVAYSSMETEDEQKDFGRAPVFYHRKDGAMIGVGKLGYAMISRDEGKTFAALPRATSLATGDAKIWVQGTSDGRYAMVHNPKPDGKMRFPLVVLSSEDGMAFKDMRLVSGEIPAQRYSGAMRAPGLQYTRGVSIFANDGSLDAIKDMFVAYSANKEDVIVARIPVPLKTQENQPVNETFENARDGGRIIPGWNIYSLLWAPVSVVDHGAGAGGGKALRLLDASPYDFARAERVFPESASATVSFMLTSQEHGDLEIELRPAFGAARPVRLVLSPDGKLLAFDKGSPVDLGTQPPGKPITISVATDCKARSYSVTVNGKTRAGLGFSADVDSLCRIEFRTGSLHPAPARNSGTDATSDKPLGKPAEFLISNVVVR